MTNYEQLLALSAREYVVALLGEHREMREGLETIADAGTVGGVSAGERKGLAMAAKIARAILAKVQAP